MEIRFWKPILITTLIAVPAYIVSFVFAFIGYGGTLIPAALFFPYAILILVLGQITWNPFLLNPAIVVSIALVQFPVYGYILGQANKAGSLRKKLRTLAIIH